MGREYNVSKQEVKRRKFDAFIRNTVFGGKRWGEDYCEVCGNFDTLQYRNGLYLCSTCSEHIRAQEWNHE